MTDKNDTSDSEDFYSADEEPKQFNVSARIRRRSSNEKRGKGRFPEQRKKDSSEQRIHKSEDSNVTNEVVNVKIGDDEERPIPPPRRKRKKTHPLLKQASAEEPYTDHKLSLNTDEKRRANTFSWPRGEKPNVQYKDKENKELSESSNSTPIHRDSQEGFESMKDTEVIVEGLVKSKTRLSTSPSISIEPDTSLEFTNEMFDNSEEVESNDMFLSRAVGSNDTREGLVIYSDDESVDGDNLLCDSVDIVLQVPTEDEEEEEEKEEEKEKEEEGVTVDAGNDDDDVTDDETKQPLLKRSRPMNIIIWTKVAKYLYSQERARVTSVIMHKQSNLLVTGFNNGTFTLHEMPDFNPIHSLSISEYRINSVAVNKTGEWLAFGSSSLGQLLVWEWQSESYILKQQGHLYDMNVMCYSPDGQLIVTGGDDGKVKLWNTSSGFCFATFSEHIAPVTAVVFGSSGKVVISASLDGTVRSFDLHRYRNFRTFVSPSPVQFTCLALDPSGEVVCAGSHDTFEIYVWSMQTGRLLEVLAGHEGPVSGLSFSPCRVVLASSSWDKTVKIWDVFENKGNTETLRYNTMALTLAFRPDGKQLSVATLDGQITLWDIDSSIQTGSIEGRNDLELGRRTEDKITAKTLSGTAHFTTLCYTADGQRLLAGGRSKYVCLYDVDHQILLNKFQTSSNKTLEGMNRLLSRQHLTEAGPLELISDEEVDSDEERRLISLPGVKKGDFSSRKTRPEIITKCLQFSPTGRAWSAVTTEGLLIYTLDNQISFDPFDMSSEVTPDSIKEAIKKREYSQALVLSLRLNEYPLVLEALEAIPIVEVELVLRDLSETYVQRILPVLSDRMNHSPHLEFYLHWCTTLLSLHTRTLKEKGLETMSFLTDLQKSIVQRQTDLGKLCDTNTYGLQYTLCMSRMEDGTKENAVTST